MTPDRCRRPCAQDRGRPGVRQLPQSIQQRLLRPALAATADGPARAARTPRSALNPTAALLFTDFSTGAVLHLSGTAATDWAARAIPAMALVARLEPLPLACGHRIDDCGQHQARQQSLRGLTHDGCWRCGQPDSSVPRRRFSASKIRSSA
jgi:hypothetical protein